MNRISINAQSCALLIAFCGYCAAVHAEQVKDIQADKIGYLRDKFSMSSISKSVAESISKADTGSVKFNKLVISATPKVVLNQVAGTPPDYKGTWTYINVGGPFVQVLDEVASNGFPTSQTYALTYRGLLYLESRTVALAEKSAPPAVTMKNLKAFTPMAASDSGAGEFEWRYQMAPHIQIMNFRDTYFHCTYGAVHPASAINAKLMGNAQDLDCESKNDNDIVFGHSVVSVLQYYGVAVLLSKSTANSTTSFTIDDVQVQ